MRDPELTVGQHSGPEDVTRVSQADFRCDQQPHHLLEVVLDDRQEERLHVVEVQVDGGRRDAGLAGDAAQGERRGGRVGEHTAGRVDDVLPEALALTARVPLASRPLSACCGHQFSPLAGS
jgi:hypothetical protein